MDSSTRGLALSTFPFLQQGNTALQDAFFEAAQPRRLPAHQFMAMEGDPCHALPLVVRGQARVYTMGDQGREITLYRIVAGESCILTASCILGGQQFPAFARADDETEQLLVPSETVHAWMRDHPAWRQFVFELIARRLASVIATVDEVAFQRLDARLAVYLLHQLQRTEGDTLSTTHEDIASELGSARAVISRKLKSFEHRGLVALGRGQITVHDAAALHRLQHTA